MGYTHIWWWLYHMSHIPQVTSCNKHHWLPAQTLCGEHSTDVWWMAVVGVSSLTSRYTYCHGLHIEAVLWMVVIIICNSPVFLTILAITLGTEASKALILADSYFRSLTWQSVLIHYIEVWPNKLLISWTQYALSNVFIMHNLKVRFYILFITKINLLYYQMYATAFQKDPYHGRLYANQMSLVWWLQ